MRDINKECVAMPSPPIKLRINVTSARRKKSNDVTVDVTVNHQSLALPEMVPHPVTQHKGALSQP